MGVLPPLWSSAAMDPRRCGPLSLLLVHHHHLAGDGSKSDRSPSRGRDVTGGPRASYVRRLDWRSCPTTALTPSRRSACSGGAGSSSSAAPRCSPPAAATAAGRSRRRGPRRRRRRARRPPPRRRRRRPRLRRVDGLVDDRGVHCRRLRVPRHVHPAARKTAGPYPLDEQFDRRDITEDYEGHPLRLGFRVVDAACVPCPGPRSSCGTATPPATTAFTDNGGGKDEGDGTTFLRGARPPATTASSSS